ncbi:MAG: hypothetical protein NVSMB49_11530 [Ktedonobacteraceae bacterium]
MVGDQAVRVDDHAEEPRLCGGVVITARIRDIESKRLAKEGIQGDLGADQRPVGSVKGGHIVDTFVNHLGLAQETDAQALIGRLEDEAVCIKSIDTVEAREIM